MFLVAGHFFHVTIDFNPCEIYNLILVSAEGGKFHSVENIVIESIKSEGRVGCVFWFRYFVWTLSSIATRVNTGVEPRFWF